jgi:hypothetical protein
MFDGGVIMHSSRGRFQTQGELVNRFGLMMGDYQRVASRVKSWTNQGVSIFGCATMSVGLWCAGVEHKDVGWR